MTRLKTYTSLFGKNWLVGRYLLPLLEDWGEQLTGVVLDLGCGESPFRMYFPHASQYLRVDRVPADTHVIRGDLLNIPLKEESVDSVLLFQALSDLPDPGKCLREIGRVLRKGGCVIIFESMCYPEHDLPDDYYRVMPAGIAYLSEKNGFVLSDLVRLGGLFTRFSQLWNFVMSRLGHFPVIGLASRAGIAAGNIVFLVLDRLFSYPRFASDYCARLVKK